MSILFNQISLSEETLLNYTHTYTYVVVGACDEQKIVVLILYEISSSHISLNKRTF